MTMRERIVELYGDGGLKRSAMNIRGGAGVFEKVLSGKGYRTVLEIGTYKGVSAAEMSQHCERVVTIDLFHGRLEQLGTPFDRKAMWDALGIKNIELKLVNNNDEKKWCVDKLDFDFAFIDGAHDAFGVRFDFDLVKRCKRVLFHDCDPANPGAVYEFVKSLSGQLEQMDIFILWQA